MFFWQEWPNSDKSVLYGTFPVLSHFIEIFYFSFLGIIFILCILSICIYIYTKRPLLLTNSHESVVVNLVHFLC